MEDFSGYLKNLYQKMDAVFHDRIVLHGPFSGMKYMEEALPYSISPKLLGTYEKELHLVIEELFSRNFNRVINIGCAEGYYAVGFALKFSKAEIICYDTNEHARIVCQKIAEKNNVGGRVQIGHLCDVETILSFDLENELIISDCEGYEKNLFLNHFVVSHLSKTFMLIEIHDFVDIEISELIYSAYEKTHNIQTIVSIDDIEKVKRYNVPEIEFLSKKERLLALSEYRPSIMEWFYMTPKDLNNL